MAHGGDASVATNGFWSALTIATTQQLAGALLHRGQRLRHLGAPASQTPGGDIAANLASFRNLQMFDGDGTDPQGAARLIAQARGVDAHWQGPGAVAPAGAALERPLRPGHAGVQVAGNLAAEKARDPLDRLKRFLVPQQIAAPPGKPWKTGAPRMLPSHCIGRSSAAAAGSGQRCTRYVFCEPDADGKPQLQRQGGVALAGHVHRAGTPSRIAEAGAHQHGHRDSPHARCTSSASIRASSSSAKTSAPRAACTP